ncbi:MAG: AbrB/MazE/SpoVT family DNA-binding domain-containing protein [Euryarchaeota archaeon]|nr:AbrB/MazE/SpoVT family DNA-binding domain-containing protein [Euryarchaeota archaeon]
MPKRSRRPTGKPGLGGMRVEAVVSVDERGQLVLPAALRSGMGIRAGDKFAVVTHQMGSRTAGITLLKVEDLAAALKEHLGPMFEHLVK